MATKYFSLNFLWKKKCIQTGQSGFNQISYIYFGGVFSSVIIKGIQKKKIWSHNMSQFKMKIKEQSEGSLEGRDVLSLSLPFLHPRRRSNSIL